MLFIIRNLEFKISLVRFRLGDEHSTAGSAASDKPLSATMAYPVARTGIVRQLQDLDAGVP